MGKIINLKDFAQEKLSKRDAYLDTVCKNFNDVMAYVEENHKEGQPLRLILREDGNIFREVADGMFFCDNTFEMIIP